MKLGAAFLANSAKNNVDGTFDVIAGGINEFRPVGGYLLGAPIQLRFALVVRIELSRREVEQLRHFQVRLFFNSQYIGRWHDIPIALNPTEGEDRYYINLILNLQYFVPKPGEGYLEMMFDDHQRLPHVHLRVKV